MRSYLNIYSIFVVISIILAGTILFQIYPLIFIKPTQKNIQEDFIIYLKKYKKGILISSTITFESKQIIKSIDTKKDTIPGTNIGYDGTMILENDKHYETVMYFASNPKQLTVLIPQNGGYVKGGLIDIKKGDEILLDRIFRYNVLGKNKTDLISNKITKLNQ